MSIVDAVWLWDGGRVWGATFGSGGCWTEEYRTVRVPGSSSVWRGAVIARAWDTPARGIPCPAAPRRSALGLARSPLEMLPHFARLRGPYLTPHPALRADPLPPRGRVRVYLRGRAAGATAGGRKTPIPHMMSVPICPIRPARSYPLPLGGRGRPAGPGEGPWHGPSSRQLADPGSAFGGPGSGGIVGRPAVPNHGVVAGLVHRRQERRAPHGRARLLISRKAAKTPARQRLGQTVASSGSWSLAVTSSSMREKSVLTCTMSSCARLLRFCDTKTWSRACELPSKMKV